MTVQKIICSVCNLDLYFLDDQYIINNFNALCSECFKKEARK